MNNIHCSLAYFCSPCKSIYSFAYFLAYYAFEINSCWHMLLFLKYFIMFVTIIIFSPILGKILRFLPLILDFSFSHLLLLQWRCNAHLKIFIYLKGRITDGGRAMGSEEREEVLVVWTGWLQRPRLGKAETKNPQFSVGSTGATSRAIHCFLMHIRRELNLNWSSQVSNPFSYELLAMQAVA